MVADLVPCDSGAGCVTQFNLIVESMLGSTVKKRLSLMPAHGSKVREYQSGKRRERTELDRSGEVFFDAVRR